MDPVTIAVIAFVVFEVASGGMVTASAVGAATEGAKAAWGETKKTANSWYSDRAKELEKTRWGRFRLRQEKRAAVTGAFLGRGLMKGAKAAPGGAKSGWAKGRQLRNDGAKLARQKAADGTATLGAKWRQRGPQRGTPDGADGGASGAPAGGSDEEPVAPRPMGCIFCGVPLEGAMCSNPECGASPKKHGGAPTGYAGDGDHEAARRQMLATVNGRHVQVEVRDTPIEAIPDDQADLPVGFVIRTGDDEIVKTGTGWHSTQHGPVTDAQVNDLIAQGKGHKNIPPTGGDDSKGENVSDSSFPAEKVGAAQYVPAWDTPGPQLELAMSGVASLVEAMAASAEANSHHEVGGVQDVVGAGQAVVEAMQAFGEAVAAHAAALHAEHDAAIEATKGSQTESQQEYAGAQ
jgi:hypothetical protein